MGCSKRRRARKAQALKVGKKYANKQDWGAGPRERCHDCAFRPGSPEMLALFAGHDESILHVSDRLSKALDGEQGHRPFYCHHDAQGNHMPVDANGTYIPERLPDGRPIGFPVCNGWLNLLDGIRAVREQDRLDALAEEEA